MAVDPKTDAPAPEADVPEKTEPVAPEQSAAALGKPAEAPTEEPQATPEPEQPAKLAAKPKKDPAPSKAEAPEAPAEPVDKTPAQEAITQVSHGAGQIDGQGILTKTNQDVIDNFPRNENGQVVIDATGRIVGLDDDKQPSQPSGAAL